MCRLPLTSQLCQRELVVSRDPRGQTRTPPLHSPVLAESRSTYASNIFVRPGVHSSDINGGEGWGSNKDESTTSNTTWNHGYLSLSSKSIYLHQDNVQCPILGIGGVGGQPPHPCHPPMPSRKMALGGRKAYRCASPRIPDLKAGKFPMESPLCHDG